jgi:glycosyltransferase involved in cell wall biosynthesis
MRLLMLSHVVRDPDAGAAGTSLRLAEALRAAGHDVTDLYKDDLMPVRPAGPIGDDLLAAVVLRVVPSVLRGRYDVVDASGFLGAGLFALLRARRRGGPPRQGEPLLVARSYGLEHSDHEALMYEVRAGRVQVSRRYRLRGGGTHLKAVAWSIRAGDAFTCPRGADGERALARGWRPSTAEVLVNGHGVTGEALAQRRDQLRPWTGRVAWCGTTVARKGWRDFVEGITRALDAQTSDSAPLGAGAAAARQTPGPSTEVQLTVDVLGSGAAPEELLRDFRPEHRAHIRVHPRLAREQQFALLALTDVFVSTSLSEGFHLALLEAMAIGLPCICTRAGFLLDEPHAQRLALLLPPRSPTHLTAALHTLAADPLRRQELACAGMQFARTRTWADVAQRHVRWLGTLRGSVSSAQPLATAVPEVGR